MQAIVMVPLICLLLVSLADSQAAQLPENEVLDAIIYSNETTATSDDYVHATWYVCQGGKYHVYVNLPEADPSHPMGGFIVFAYASKYPDPTACDFNSTGGWTNFDNQTLQLHDGFEVEVEDGDVVYFGFSCPPIITKNALFSVSVSKSPDGGPRPQPPARARFSISMLRPSMPASPIRLQSAPQMTCQDSKTQTTPLLPAFSFDKTGQVQYEEHITYLLQMCNKQIPSGANVRVYTIVSGRPGASAFESYLYDNGTSTLLGSDSDKHFVSQIRFGPVKRQELPDSLTLRITGYGGEFNTGANPFQLSVFLDIVS